MDYFSLMVKKEFYIASIVNMLCDIINLFRYKENRIVKKCLADAKKEVRHKKAFIILNAPSVNKQNLFKLSDVDVAFVNRGFKHPDYKRLHPQYHIICDPKFIRGIWPVSWIYDILDLVPDITFVFPVEWEKEDVMQELMVKNIKICWIRIRDKSFSPFVAGFSISFLMSLDYKTIYFTGCEANGLGHELVRDISHFYGKNEENTLKHTKEYIIDFYMYMLNYHYFGLLANRATNSNVEIINLTIGGCLDMFKRENLLE